MLPFQNRVYVRKTELTEDGNFHLFAANGKWKGPISVCFLQMENGSLFSLVCKWVNGIRRLLFQQMCPSMV